MKDANRTSHGLVFLIVLLDIIGFAIIFPLYPAMLEHYLALEGDASWVGRLAAELRGLAGGEEFAVVTLFGGLLGSLYGFLQFLFAPFWGALSDRVGRRPTLVLTTAGTVASYVLWAFAGSFELLLLARFLGGAMAGNISTATAVIADTTTGEKRAGGMGMVGAAIGLGFLFGPALGGLFGGGADLAAEWSTGFAVNPFTNAALAAGALALLNLVLVATRLPETRPAGGAASGERVRNPLATLGKLSGPGVVATNVLYLVYLTAFAAMEFTLTFLAVERFDFTIRDNTWMFVFVGIVIVFVQGGLVRRLAPRVGERRLAALGLLLVVPGLVVVGLSPSVTVLYAGLFLLAFGSALAMPSLSSLASKYAPADRQGLALGTFRSLGSLARAIGPFLGGVAYWQAGSRAPYLGAALLLLLPLWLATRLPAPPGDPGPAA